MHDANDNWPNVCAHHASHSQCTFRYAERQPDPTPTPWIAAYWEFCALLGAASVDQVPPDGCTSLLVPTSGPPVATLCNASMPAAFVGGVMGQALQRDLASCVTLDADLDHIARAFDAFWLRECARFARPYPLVSSVIDALLASHGRRMIGELAAAHGC